MASLMPVAKQQYFIPGTTIPLINGKLYTYTAGTSILKPTYQDAAGTTPNTNPITLDSTGSALIFWTGNYKIVLKDALGNTIYTVDNYNTDLAAALQTQIATSTGSSLIGFIQAGVGAVVQAVQAVLRERVTVTQFGADPTGVEDSTAAFQRAMAYVTTLGGGRIRIPNGSYMLTNFEVDQQRVIFEGETGGYSYEKITSTTTVGVRLFPGTGATWVVRLKGTTTGAAAQGSGLRNVVIIDTSPGAHEYGLIEDSAGTILDDITVQDFQYTHVMPAAVNANVHRRVATLGATKMGFLVSEFQAKSYMHPNVPDIPDIGNTVFFRSGCVIRQNEWGCMIRDAIGASMVDTVIESNLQAGMYIYRVDVSTVRAIKFGKVHFENNYDGITADVSGYSITGNRAFLIGGASTYIAWTASYQAGYQLVIDSQTHAGTGGPDNLVYDGCEFNCDNVYQRDILQLSGTSVEYRRTNFGGTGDDNNRILCTTDAKGTLFWEPSWKNDPTADVPSLVANFGANLGTRGALIRAGNRTNELGGLYSDRGVFGGVFHFRDLDPADPRRADPRCFDDYHEVDNFNIPWRTGSATPFAVSGEDNKATKWGREVIVRCKGILTVTTATGGPDSFFCNAFLPFQTDDAGFLTGEVLIEPLGGGAAVVNNGWAPMKTNGVASAISALNVFAALNVGMTFSYEVKLSYCTAT